VEETLWNLRGADSILMQKLNIELVFSTGKDRQSYTRSLDLDSDLGRASWELVASHVFRECQMEILYRRYRRALPDVKGFFEGRNAYLPVWHDLVRVAAQKNTFEVWWQIQNTFFEAAHLLAQSGAYDEIERLEGDEDRRQLVHLKKLQAFNLTAYLLGNKIEDWFLLLLFVNSGCSLIRGIDVHRPDWLKKIKRKDIATGLKKRRRRPRSARSSRASQRYLDSLADEEYQTVVDVFKKLRKPKSVRVMREYRNEIAHRGVPAVDYPGFSPRFTFPRKEGKGTQLAIPGPARVDYKFVELYTHASAALNHLAAQLRRMKSIAVFAAG